MMERATMATSFPKDQIKFLLLENVHQSAHDLIRSEGFALEAVPRSLKEDELAQKLRDVHVLGIRSKTQVTARALAEARRPRFQRAVLEHPQRGRIDHLRGDRTGAAARGPLARGARGPLAQGRRGLLRGPWQDARRDRLWPHRL